MNNSRQYYNHKTPLFLKEKQIILVKKLLKHSPSSNCLKVVDDSICLTSVNLAESDVLVAINRMKKIIFLPLMIYLLFCSNSLSRYLSLALHCFLISYCLLLLHLVTGKMLSLYRLSICHYTCS